MLVQFRRLVLVVEVFGNGHKGGKVDDVKRDPWRQNSSRHGPHQVQRPLSWYMRPRLRVHEPSA